MIPDGIYDVQESQQRQWYRHGKLWGWQSAETLPGSLFCNPVHAVMAQGDFGHYPDLPAPTPTCLCGAPSTRLADGSIHIPCGH